jgi:hypothetical protein
VPRSPLLLLALVAVVAAGCGGGGGPTRLSHEDFVAQGEAICVAASGKIDALGDPASLADIARIGAQLAAIRDAEATRLAALVPAQADAAGHARMLTALRARNRTLHAVVTAARRNDQAAASKALAAGGPLGDRASDAAVEIGLLRCAEGG